MWKLKVLVKWETPGGDLNAPEDTFEQQIILFSVTPYKNQKEY